jgi:ligand-binding sensor domain-containing protein
MRIEHFPRILIITIAFLLLSGFCFSQTWMHFDTQNSGIPNSVINRIVCDNNLVYVATNNGIGIFDGANWTGYSTSNSPLPHNVCYALTIQQDILWIGTVAGLCKVENGNWTIYNFSNSNIPDEYITDIQIEDSSSLWIATYYGGCARFDGSSFTTYNQFNSGLLSNRVISIGFQNSNNTAWIASPPFGGVSAFDQSGWINYNPANSDCPSYGVWGICVDSLNTAWFATEDGIATYDGINWTIFDSSNTSFIDNRFNGKPNIGTDGHIWFTSVENGIVEYTGSNWFSYNTSNSSITDNNTISVFVDQNNNKWIGGVLGLDVYNEFGVNLSVDEMLNQHVIIYPNPCSSQITVKINSAFCSCSIFTFEGIRIPVSEYSIVKSIDLLQVNTENLISGYYTLVVIENSGNVIKSSFIKL